MNVKPADLGPLPSPRELGGSNWRHAIGAGCAGSFAVLVLGVLGLSVAIVWGVTLPDTAWAWPELLAGAVFALVMARWGLSEVRGFSARQGALEATWLAHRARSEGVLSVTGLMAQIAELGLQRDLDGDGIVGVPVAPPRRLIPYRSGEHQATLQLNSATGAALPEPVNVGGLIEFGDVQVYENDLRAFVEGLYTRGLGRRQWAGVTLPSGQKVTKDYHAKTLAGLGDLGLVAGRGERNPGRLVYASVGEALGVLGLD